MDVQRLVISFLPPVPHALFVLFPPIPYPDVLQSCGVQIVLGKEGRCMEIRASALLGTLIFRG